MTDYSRVLRLLWPTLLFVASVIAYVFHESAIRDFAPEASRDAMGKLVATTTFFSGAWLLSRITRAALGRRASRRRRAPKLLGDVVTAMLFLLAGIGAVTALTDQSAGGALVSSGLIIAVIGFAIRNVLADVLSGIALGLEAPFRIGDWIEIEGVVRGRVIEIGWRTTRLLTPDETYMILPNSEISRQRLINYSAPRKSYRTSLEMVLGHEIAVELGKKLLVEAAASTESIMKSPSPDVRAISYDTDGVRYAIRYWVQSLVKDADCRDELLIAVDASIRMHGISPPFSRVKLVSAVPEIVESD